MEEQKSIREIPNKITITVIGNRYSGKTTLLNSLIFPQIINNNNYTKTYGYDIRFLQINDNTIIKFFDIGDLGEDRKWKKQILPMKQPPACP